MWLNFALCFAAGAFILLLPGALTTRSFRFPWVYTLAIAPGCSVALYTLIGAVLPLAGVSANGFVVAGLAFAIGVLSFVASLCLAWRRGELSSFWVDRRLQGSLPSWEMAVYLLLGFVVSVGLLVRSFDGPESLTQTYDNVLHYGAVRAFLDSGNWSFLSMGQYGTGEDAALDPLSTAGFYPAAWHVMAALVSDVTGASPALASNVVNTAFCSLVFPLGMFALLSALFPERRLVVLSGAFVSAAFAAFPWALYMSWPLFPYGSALSVVPSVVFCFVGFFSRFAQVRRAGYLVVFLISCVAVALLQPSGIFVAAVLLAPYCVCLAVFAAGKIKVRGWRLCALRLLAGVVATAFVAGIWVALYKAPFLQAVVNFQWVTTLEPSRAVADALLFAVEGNPPQWILSALVFLGMARSLCDSSLRWLPFSFIFAVVIFVAAASLEGEARHLLSGFWYTDPYRVGAFVALGGMPLAALGAAVVAKGLALAIPRRKAVGATLLAFMVGAASCAGAYLVSFQGTTNYSFLLEQGETNASTGDDRPFGEKKRLFVEKAKAIVGDDGLVLNNPFDGSMYAYGATGLRTYYRDMGGYGATYESPKSLAIRERLARIGSDDDVAEAVEALGARYLLVLNDEAPIGWFSPVYLPVQWEGLTQINDETPGLEVVLAEDDMRLYRLSRDKGGSDDD